MKIIKIRKSTLLIILIIFVFTIVITRISTSFSMQNYYNVDFSTGLVTASTLNVRSGPRNELPRYCKSI